MIETQTAHLSRIGGRRRNEDACGYWGSPRGGCWVVSDGAGGHGSGDVASRMVVSTVLERFAATPRVDAEFAVALLEAAHQTVMAAKQAKGADDMHATCVLLLIDPEGERAVWAHAGDSRLYLFRDGKPVYQTRDHSLVQSMIDAGYGTTEMIRSHPQRSLLTSAIGNAGELELSVSGEPLRLRLDDVFLLCSDGWWEYVEEAQMQTLLADTDTMQGWLERMAAQIEAQAGKDNDNYTAVGVCVNADDSPDTVIL